MRQNMGHSRAHDVTRSREIGGLIRRFTSKHRPHMPSLFLILLLDIVFTLSLLMPVTSQAEGFCPKAFARLFARLRPSVQSQGPARELADLHPAVRRWLKLQATAEPTPHIDQIVHIENAAEGGAHKIIAYLGKGEEASVYLAETPRGLRVLKFFKRPTDLVSNYQKLSQQRGALRTPAVHAVDMNRNIMVLEYAEGLPLDVIKHDYEKLGLTAKEKDRILQEWERAQVTNPELRRPPYLTINVIYNFRDREFQMIDPH